MLEEIKEEFFKVFEIEKGPLCKHAMYGYMGSEGTWYKCLKNDCECWTYPNDTSCEHKEVSYPKITHEILLKLICLTNNSSLAGCNTIEKIKNKVLFDLMLSEKTYESEELKQNVQKIFKDCVDQHSPS